MDVWSVNVDEIKSSELVPVNVALNVAFVSLSRELIISPAPLGESVKFPPDDVDIVAPAPKVRVVVAPKLNDAEVVRVASPEAVIIVSDVDITIVFDPESSVKSPADVERV